MKTVTLPHNNAVGRSAQQTFVPGFAGLGHGRSFAKPSPCLLRWASQCFGATRAVASTNVHGARGLGAVGPVTTGRHPFKCNFRAPDPGPSGEQIRSSLFRSVANEVFGMAKDIAIMTEGALSWNTGFVLQGAPDAPAADVASDPLANQWDEVVRVPPSLHHQASGIAERSGPGRPAA
jgi:hypothetical protein